MSSREKTLYKNQSLGCLISLGPGMRNQLKKVLSIPTIWVPSRVSKPTPYVEEGEKIMINLTLSETRLSGPAIVECSILINGVLAYSKQLPLSVFNEKVTIWKKMEVYLECHPHLVTKLSNEDKELLYYLCEVGNENGFTCSYIHGFTCSYTQGKVLVKKNGENYGVYNAEIFEDLINDIELIDILYEQNQEGIYTKEKEIFDDFFDAISFNLDSLNPFMELQFTEFETMKDAIPEIENEMMLQINEDKEEYQTNAFYVRLREDVFFARYTYIKGNFEWEYEVVS